MGTVLWIALAAWLVLSVLGTIVLAALARGGQREDRHRLRRHLRLPRPR
jgi:hypothetical protein